MTQPVKSLYDQYVDLLKILGPGAQRNEVQDLRGQAVSYVWGWEDAGGISISNATWDFSLAYGMHCAQYALGNRPSRKSIQDSWKLWRENGYKLD